VAENANPEPKDESKERNIRMELKNALAVCLISLFSATLVVLIARTLDMQTASQLEPRLAEIAEELRAIRRQGGVASDEAATSANVSSGLVVYYFHGNTRCERCRSLEAQTKERLDADFSEPCKRGDIVWKVLNHEKPSGAVLALKFEVKDPVIVLARMKDGQIDAWKRLDKGLALADNQAALTDYLRGEIQKMLDSGGNRTTETTAKPEAETPVPNSEKAPTNDPPAIPIP
jgi:hypothetical protein